MLRATVIVLVVVGVVSAQSPRIAFDVASVKLANPRSPIDMHTFPNGRLNATACTLKQLVMGAYGIKEQYQVLGGPSWAEADRFDIEAKVAGDFSQDRDRVTALGRDAPRKMMLMLQTLLAERFNLKFHHETRQDTVYRLVVGKSGPKLTPASDTAKQPYVGLGREGSPAQRAASYYIFGTNASMALLADRLQGVLRHPVLNETGISGNFDFRFDYSTTDTEN